MTDPFSLSSQEFTEIGAKLGLSPQALAHVLGVTTRQVYRYVRGENPVKGAVARLMLMLKKHGVPADWRDQSRKP